MALSASANNMQTVDVPTFQEAIKSLSLPDVKSKKQSFRTEDQSSENRAPPARQSSIPKFFAGLAVGVSIILAYLFYIDYFPHAMNKKNTDYFRRRTHSGRQQQHQRWPTRPPDIR